MVFFNINSFIQYGIEVRMNRLIALILGMMVLSSCSREKIEMRIDLKDVLYNSSSENTLSYSDRQIYPSTGARGTGEGGGISLGKEKFDYYTKTVFVMSKNIFILMNGSYEVEIKMFLKGKLCGKGNFKNDGPPKQVRLECRI
jgi:hypothetical protein